MSLQAAEEKARYFQGLKPQEDTVKGHGIRTAEGECQYMLPSFQQKIAANPKLRLLDVGCGPGSITLGLARLMPDGEAIGFDLSDTVLAKAREDAQKQGVTNLNFVRGDVYSLPFEDGYFDVVHTHQAVAHFHEHVQAIKELVRVTKKGGGIICMREGDLHSFRCYPHHPLMEECWEMVIKCFKSNHDTATDAGMRLKHWTVEAGVPRENITATAGSWYFHTPEGRQVYGAQWPGRITTGPFAETAVRMGFATK
ncbi:hypothetical protein LTR36_007387 [Oleoguttula mirabilis]|uniref:Methyltransferase domain-containing protein n=1 Tax=Oleoguttula mirabilis TaxID=1507867 RepID=A0AAV9J9R0_9PEZI|nr:hypothetical protein LTR36_007387 [Oleoguttula mirabilis]